MLDSNRREAVYGVTAPFQARLEPLDNVAGGDRGTRTPNLGIANAALSQLSYIPTLGRGSNYSTGIHPGPIALPGGPQ